MFSVEAKNVVKRFGTKTVLNGISFAHSQGVLGIAGPNGSGKSTLLKCLSGLLKPTSGSISWNDGQSGLSEKELRGHLGFMAPYINLYHELSVLENVEFILQLRKREIPADAINRRLHYLQLAEIRHQAFGELSTGQQQRARLACTLIYDPAVLFLDEPGANLDDTGTSLIRDVIENSKKKEKLVFLASNNQEELNLADIVVSVV